MGESEGGRFILGDVVDHAGDPAVRVGPAQLLGGDFLAGGGLHQRRTRQKDRAGPANDDRLVAHRRNICPARRATTEDNGNLPQALG